ncbi:MAG: hypothetical protein WDN44_14160 [Sphingomonas sp.]
MLIVAVVLTALGALVYAAAFLVHMATQQVADRITPISTLGSFPTAAFSREETQRELTDRFVARTVIPILYVMVPVIGAIVWLLRPRPGVKSALKRMTDTGRRGRKHCAAAGR